MSMWSTGLHLLGAEVDEENRVPKRLEYLRTMMLRNPENVSSVVVLRVASVSTRLF